jgi:hypothetical protein
MANLGGSMFAFTYVSLILAVGALAAGLWRLKARRAARAGLGTWEDVLARASQGGYRLIGTAELAKLYLANNNNLLPVDTRPHEGYQKGHIEGAVSFPLAPTGWARWSCRRVLAELLGPDKQRLLVFY